MSATVKAKEAYAFPLPFDSAVAKSIVAAIPDDWWCLEGSLSAPEKLIREQKTVKMCYRVDHQEIRVIPYSAKLGSDFEALVTLGKLPGGIEFEHTFQHVFPYTSSLPVMQRSLSIAQAKNIVTHFLGLDYQGRLNFHCRHLNYDPIQNSERCELYFWPEWPRGKVVKSNSVPLPVPLVKVSYYDEGRYGGKDTIEPILKKCWSLGLKEIRLND